MTNKAIEETDVATGERKWNFRYLEMAELVSGWSKDPSSKIGAVAVGDYGQILSTGYNGFPRRIEDDESRLANRETKLKYVVHAEMNLIYNASLNGVSLNGCSVYVHGLPICSECAKGLIQAGVDKVVVRKRDVTASERWYNSWLLSYEMFEEAGVVVQIMGEE